MLIFIIQFNASKANKLDLSIALYKIYYQSLGYQKTFKKLHKASQKAGYDFTLAEVNS